MEAVFNTLIDSYINDKVGIADRFLSESLSANLRQNLLALFNQKKMHLAGTGNGARLKHDTLIRGDSIHWLDRAHNDIYENRFFDLIDKFVQFLNENCFTGIKGYEFHYTLYGPGTFYKRHLDRFQNNESRQFSMIMYLNADWKKEDGGELCIQHEGGVQLIAPTDGKVVFFKSNELEHEVLLTNRNRMSITGWLKA